LILVARGIRWAFWLSLVQLLFGAAILLLVEPVGGLAGHFAMRALGIASLACLVLLWRNDQTGQRSREAV
jgi:hypothetical protein